MRVAYLDTGFSREEYGLHPTRYGGGAVAARYLKEDPEVDFHVIAPQEAFNNVNVDTERFDRCIGMPPDLCKALQNGLPIDALLRHLPAFDLVLHPHTCFSPNRGAFKGPVVHFAGFDGSCGHPRNDYILLYNPTFRAQFGERARYVTIGKPVPATYPGYEGRERLVFQCTRHDDTMNSIALAKQCLAEGFKGVFAGPIHNGYPLLDHIDGQTTIYLGEISEAEKLAWYRRASLFGLLHQWPTMPFSQSVIEAQGQGTPIYTYPQGPFLGTYLQHGVNGFDADLVSLSRAYERVNEAMSRASWQAARAYDVPVMTASFKRAFESIVAEWRVTHPTL